MTTRDANAHDVFIEGWGRLGTTWGISKVMAEIYALLYLSPDPLTLEDMSDMLKTSRSNISMNVRGLLDLGVVQKIIVRGERKDYYLAESDIGKVAKLLAVAKKKKELDPAMEIVDKSLELARDDDELLQTRLGELKRHMDFVNAIFHAFVGGESGNPDLVDVIKIKEGPS
jgi:DNA-binding transcriptional regulator GbsR (MarR family)